MFDAIDKYVARCSPLPPADLDYFHSLLRPRQVAAREWLLHEGEVCDWEAYVLKGCLRKYCIDEQGTEIILQFAVEDWWISDLSSFSEGTPSRLNIQALEPSELLLIHHDDKEALFRRVPAFERMFRLMLQRSYTVLQDRFLSTLSQPAEDRYLAFLERYGNIAQRIPQHYIASYLGITPEALSRVRGKLARKV